LTDAEYRCDDRRFPRDRGYRHWVAGLYLKWYESTAGGGIEYNPALGAFVAPEDKRDNVDSHLDWGSGCRAETHRAN